MTKAELNALVTGFTGRTDKDALINTLLLVGLREIAKTHDFMSMVSTVDIVIPAPIPPATNTPSVSLPANWHHVFEARLINGSSSMKFEIHQKNWVVERWPNITDTNVGIPVLGYIEGGNVYLYPAANALYGLRVTLSTLPSDDTFGDGADECPIPLAEMPLVYWVCERILKGVGAYEEGQVYGNDYRLSLIDSIRTDRRAITKDYTPLVGSESDIPKPDSYLDPFARR